VGRVAKFRPVHHYCLERPLVGLRGLGSPRSARPGTRTSRR
jgi:hypothetical protein